jgi:heme exporter protein D
MIYWNSLSDFLAMGGYAGYVWWSFGITAACMVAEPLLVGRRRRAIITRLQRQLRAEARNNP